MIRCARGGFDGVLGWAVTIAGPRGERQTLLRRGAQLPARARAVFATQRAGERALSFRLYEGEAESPEGLRLIGSWRADLPPGLPANTWLAVHVEVAADGAVRASVRENLRRLDLRPECDPSGAEASGLRAAS